jgi:hypothetical protein
MVTFSKLEKKGNLGNQLFQIAATIGIAKSNQHGYCFPNWSFQPYFKTVLPAFENLKYERLQENKFHYEPVLLGNKDYDVEGWFQSEKYFDLHLTKKHFQFKIAEVEKIKSKYFDLFSKPVLFISIRRGDFVDHKDYFQLPISYYLNALHAHFPDWKNYHLFVTSDDIAYCKFHFSSLQNVFFGIDASAIEQLLIASLSKDFIISNSTFSWWCAWFGESNAGKIIRPQSNFTPQKNKVSSDKDYFPERWIAYHHLDKKINCQDVIFCQKTSNDTIENYVNNYFSFDNNNSILVSELRADDLILKNKRLLVLADYIIPPFALYDALFSSQNSNKSFCYNLKGKLLKSSKFFDFERFSRFWDYGVFTKILSENITVNKNKIVFLIFSNSELRDQEVLKLSSSIFKNKNLEIRSTLAGTIETFAFRFFIVQTSDFCKRKIKKEIKNFIKKYTN